MDMRASYLLIEELKIRSALVFDVLRLVGLVVPILFLLPLFVFVLVVIVRKFEVILLLRLFTICVAR
jgi:hypothetical protein